MVFHLICVYQKAKGITRNMVMPRPDLPHYMLNTLTKEKKHMGCSFLSNNEELAGRPG